MTSNASKWANDDDEETAAALALRKREKEEKKRFKEEKARKAAAASQAADHSTSQEPTLESERPSKRQRTSEEQNGTSEEGAHLLHFPTSKFGACRHVDEYELLNNIEEGGYGVVSRARTKASGEIVALKKLKMTLPRDGFPISGLREIQILRACRHDNVVKLLEVVTKPGSKSRSKLNDTYLVLEFLEHDLKTLLEDLIEPFSPSETKALLLQIVSGVEYLHSNWIIHRDLKTSNILLNNRGELKLADFGISRYTSSPRPKLTTSVVTLWYRAPELLLGAEDYHFEIDIWSIGCIFAELLTTKPPFQGRNEVDQLSQIFDLLGTPTKQAWPSVTSLPNAKDLQLVLSEGKGKPSTLGLSKFLYLTTSGLALLSSLLSMNPAGRPSAGEILPDMYFTEDPRPKAKAMFPTFPSKAGQEKRRRRASPQAPARGNAPKLDEAEVEGIFAGREHEERGAGFSLRLG
ncbi:protein kinase [Exophiala viscosa]|uniref:protein kinase n=1 Tax=Exophiala viscosa TaxID=2486360 RepID=UPI00218D6689|nr:protein kinase [Exophiala viscosa]